MLLLVAVKSELLAAELAREGHTLLVHPDMTLDVFSTRRFVWTVVARQKLIWTL